VHRSDDSGTTQNFTDYLDQTSDGAWTGKAIQTWPVKGGEGAEGTSGVVAAVKGGDGTIGYADESQAGDLAKASIKVGSDFTAPTAEAASKVLDASKQISGRAATDIAITVNRKVTDSSVYPIVLISYQIACQKYDDKAQAELVKAWLTYVTSADGQQVAASSAGSAPLSAAFVTKAQAAAATISASAPSRAPARPLPRFSTTTPPKPTSRPIVSRRFGHCPYSPENAAANSGMLATATAAMPELTDFSAKHTRPLPSPSSSVPVIAALRHCGNVGAAMPRNRRKPYMTTPAHRTRTPASRNGG
jgi:hypothetical protein